MQVMTTTAELNTTATGTTETDKTKTPEKEELKVPTLPPKPAQDASATTGEQPAKIEASATGAPSASASTGASGSNLSLLTVNPFPEIKSASAPSSLPSTAPELNYSLKAASDDKLASDKQLVLPAVTPTEKNTAKEPAKEAEKEQEKNGQQATEAAGLDYSLNAAYHQQKRERKGASVDSAGSLSLDYSFSPSEFSLAAQADTEKAIENAKTGAGETKIGIDSQLGTGSLATATDFGQMLSLEARNSGYDPATLASEPSAANAQKFESLWGDYDSSGKGGQYESSYNSWANDYYGNDSYYDSYNSLDPYSDSNYGWDYYSSGPYYPSYYSSTPFSRVASSMLSSNTQEPQGSFFYSPYGASANIYYGQESPGKQIEDARLAGASPLDAEKVTTSDIEKKYAYTPMALIS